MCERWRQYLALRIVLAFFIHVSLLAAREDHFSLKRIFSGSMSGLRVVPWDAPLSPYMAKGCKREGGGLEGFRKLKLLLDLPSTFASGHWTSGCGRTEKVGPDMFDIPIPQRLSSRTLVALAIY